MLWDPFVLTHAWLPTEDKIWFELKYLPAHNRIEYSVCCLWEILNVLLFQLAVMFFLFNSCCIHFSKCIQHPVKVLQIFLTYFFLSWPFLFKNNDDCEVFWLDIICAPCTAPASASCHHCMHLCCLSFLCFNDFTLLLVFFVISSEPATSMAGFEVVS